jgi:hypothetical protein
MVGYGISRNVPAVDKDGKDTRICLCLIRHENGYEQRHAIPESLIQYAGEGVIELEVQEAALKGGEQYIRGAK